MLQIHKKAGTANLSLATVFTAGVLCGVRHHFSFLSYDVCFLCHCPVSCVPNVASVFELSILSAFSNVDNEMAENAFFGVYTY